MEAKSVFGSDCAVSGGGEVVGALGGGEGADDMADGVPEALGGAHGGLAQYGLQLGEGVLDWIEVGAVGRELEQARASGVDGSAFMAAECVHHDGFARPQFGCEHLFGTLPAAHRVIEAWRSNGNTTRPQTSLKWLKPAALAHRPASERMESGICS